MFGKFRKPKKILVTCPYCKKSQDEPSIVVSSFCRSCGEHFRIQKGTGVSTPGTRVSGISPARSRKEEREDVLLDEDLEDGTEKTGLDAWLRSARGGETQSRALDKHEEEPEEDGQLTAGGFFGFAPEVETESDDTEGLGAKAQDRETLGEGSMSAMIGELSEKAEQTKFGEDQSKMPPNYVPPDRRRRNEDRSEHREVRCFRCNHIQKVPRNATSTQCGRCSVYIGLSDYEIKSHKTLVLRTRGNVTIHRKGSVKDCELACHHLLVAGPVDATLDCSGNVTFRHHANVKGNLNCRHLVVERGCEVQFADGVIAGSVEVSGTVRGRITCSGKVLVHRSGLVEGDVIAPEIEVRDGGEISGKQKIESDVDITVPLKAGFNPSIIE